MKEKPALATDLELLVLEHAKRGLGPSAAQRRLTLDRLSTALAALPAPVLADSLLPEPALPDAPGARAPLATSSPSASAGAPAAVGLGRFSLHAMIAGVATGALVGFGAGVLASSAEAPSAAPPTVATSRALAPRAPRSAPHGERHPRGAPPRGALPEPAPAPSATAVGRQAARTRPSPERSNAPSPPSANSELAQATFYEELSYVRRAQSALQQGNGTLALGLMQSLDEIQASGALMAERRMTRVLALCQLDRTAEATEVARSMLSGDGTADVYRRRLAGSCAGAGLLRAVEQEPQ